MSSPILSNLHTHTVYSDGHGRAEEYILAAIEKGFVSIGFSEHAWTPYDAACCIKQKDVPAYLAEIAELRERYRDRIEVYLGWEGDCYHPTPKEGVDFTIASVHYQQDPATGDYYTIDFQPEMFQKAVETVGGGSVRRMVENYFACVEEMIQREHHDIVGHLDLIKKLNGDGRYFDEESGWYRAAVEHACQVIAEVGCVVEVNSGGIYRGYRQDPYPGLWALQRLHERGVPVMIASDAHHVEALNFWFEESTALVRQAGYRSVVRMQGGRFVEVGI